MAKTPVTLEDVKAALDRLETVVDRVIDRLDKVVDEDVHPIKEAVEALKRQARETEITGDWTLGRTDEIGADKPSRKEVQGQVRIMVPQTVERVRVRGKVVTRARRA